MAILFTLTFLKSMDIFSRIIPKIFGLVFIRYATPAFLWRRRLTLASLPIYILKDWWQSIGMINYSSGRVTNVGHAKW
jgi:hypothetical protein